MYVTKLYHEMRGLVTFEKAITAGTVDYGLVRKPQKLSCSWREFSGLGELTGVWRRFVRKRDNTPESLPHLPGKNKCVAVHSRG